MYTGTYSLIAYIIKKSFRAQERKHDGDQERAIILSMQPLLQHFINSSVCSLLYTYKKKSIKKMLIIQPAFKMCILKEKDGNFRCLIFTRRAGNMQLIKTTRILCNPYNKRLSRKVLPLHWLRLLRTYLDSVISSYSAKISKSSSSSNWPFLLSQHSPASEIQCFLPSSYECFSNPIPVWESLDGSYSFFRLQGNDATYSKAK